MSYSPLFQECSIALFAYLLYALKYYGYVYPFSELTDHFSKWAPEHAKRVRFPEHHIQWCNQSSCANWVAGTFAKGSTDHLGWRGISGIPFLPGDHTRNDSTDCLFGPGSFPMHPSSVPYRWRSGWSFVAMGCIIYVYSTSSNSEAVYNISIKNPSKITRIPLSDIPTYPYIPLWLQHFL